MLLISERGISKMFDSEMTAMSRSSSLECWLSLDAAGPPAQPEIKLLLIGYWVHQVGIISLLKMKPVLFSQIFSFISKITLITVPKPTWRRALMYSSAGGVRLIDALPCRSFKTLTGTVMITLLP